MKDRVRAGLRIPYELNTWLILRAEKLGMSKNALILQILGDWVDNRKQKERKEGGYEERKETYYSH